MIPKISIIQWRKHAPWPTDEQVEQDLILSRILCELYSESLISENLIFRGGTALHKLYLPISGRYSEDIDLVQIQAKSIGTLIDAIRKKLDLWLGVPNRKSGEGRFTLYYRFNTNSDIPTQRKIKIEINTREHFSILGVVKKEFIINSSWFNSRNFVSTYELEELIATKLRALYQRKKGRDLFDVWLTLQLCPHLDTQKIVDCFKGYLGFENRRISKLDFEKNLLLKKDDPVFTADLSFLLAKNSREHTDSAQDFEQNNMRNFVAQYNIQEAVDLVLQLLISKI